VTQELNFYRRAWDAKPVLRAVYGDYFDRIARQCVAGPTLEIGSGIGNLKEKMADVWASDIQFGSSLDLVADAQRLPFPTASLGNVVMLDALHHVEWPLLFLRETARVLRSGGRIVMVEPAITLGSTLFFRCFHRERVSMSVDPLMEGTPRADRDPYDSNQAIPTLIATDFRDRLHALIPELRIAEVRWFSFLAWPLSGGFQRWSLIPEWAVAPLLRVERLFESALGRYFGFRMILVMEKQ
jgi:SAM-dependent methyltransferase